MITIQVCVGSSCYLRGAKDVINKLEELVDEHGLHQEVSLKGRFCMDKCTDGVTVQIGDRVLTNITPDQVPDLFREQVVKVLGDAKGDD